MVDWATPAFKTGAALARAVPAPLARRTGELLGTAAGFVPTGRRRLVARNLRRVRPGLSERELRSAVRATFASYGRYWVESFRLPGTPPAELAAHFTTEGYEHLEEARAAGRGAIMALPHLGGWEWAGFWLTTVAGVPMTVVVERLQPPELFEWFADLRRRLGFEVVGLGPEAGAACTRALRANRALALLCDRDIGGDGVPVELFGEGTTLPAGPATLALRTGAPLLPVAVYHDGPGHHAVVRPPIPVERAGRLRDDVARITRLLAAELEVLIARAPEQWHLMQPNWPSDR
ncbi:MAG: phosphatidylinositol mannoside acyltransferase [Acidimicrobiia bacterium]